MCMPIGNSVASEVAVVPVPVQVHIIISWAMEADTTRSRASWAVSRRTMRLLQAAVGMSHRSPKDPPYNPFYPALHNINLRIPARPADVAISTTKSKNFPVEATYLQQARQIQAGSSPYQGPRNPVGLPPSATFVPAGGARPVGTFPYLQKPKKPTVSSSKLTKNVSFLGITKIWIYLTITITLLKWTSCYRGDWLLG